MLRLQLPMKLLKLPFKHITKVYFITYLSKLVYIKTFMRIRLIRMQIDYIYVFKNQSALLKNDVNGLTLTGFVLSERELLRFRFVPFVACDV